MANYTLTISPTPSTATVKINGIIQTSSSIPENTSVIISVSAVGYSEITNTITMPSANTTLNISLINSLNINYMSKIKADSISSLPENSLNFVDASAGVETVQMLGIKTSDFTIECYKGNIITFTLGSNLTITLNSNSNMGECRVITLFITNGGAYTITWPTTIKWPNSTTPTFSSANTDILTLVTNDGGNIWFGSLSGSGY